MGYIVIIWGGYILDFGVELGELLVGKAVSQIMSTAIAVGTDANDRGEWGIRRIVEGGGK